MTDWKQLQKEVYQNKLDHHFNVTDVNMEFCHLYGEVGEAYTPIMMVGRGHLPAGAGGDFRL